MEIREKSCVVSLEENERTAAAMIRHLERSEQAILKQGTIDQEEVFEVLDKEFLTGQIAM